jgi:exodeoxyribonuclease VII large subunit
VGDGRRLANVHLVVLERKAGVARLDRERRLTELSRRTQRLASTGTDASIRRAADLERLALALGAHDPELALARGYALVEDPEGAPVTSAAGAVAAGELGLRFHDGRVRARVADLTDPAEDSRS